MSQTGQSDAITQKKDNADSPFALALKGSGARKSEDGRAGRPLSRVDGNDLKVAALDESYILPRGTPFHSSELLVVWLL